MTLWDGVTLISVLLAALIIAHFWHDDKELPSADDKTIRK